MKRRFSQKQTGAKQTATEGEAKKQGLQDEEVIIHALKLSDFYLTVAS